MIAWLRHWWAARQRSIDIEILWPCCKENAHNLDEARAAFAFHAFGDSAWLILGEDEICNRIDNLT